MIVKHIIAISLITCAIIAGACTAIVGGAMSIAGAATLIHLIGG